MTEHTQPQPEMPGQHRGLSVVGVAAVAWLALGITLTWGLVARGIDSLHMSAEQANSGGAAGMDNGEVLHNSVALGLVALMLLLYMGFSTRGISWSSLGIQRRPAPRSPATVPAEVHQSRNVRRDGQHLIFGGAAGAAVLYLAAFKLAALVLQVLSARQAGGDRSYPGMGIPGAQLLPGDITSVIFGGGIWEELMFLAIPVALFTALVPLKGMGHTGRWFSWSVLVAVLLAVRWAIHLYYGLSPALWVLVWAAAGFVLFRVSGTIWPLILAHSLYDAAGFTAARIPATESAVTWLLWAAVAAGVIVLVLSGRSWWKRTRLTSGGGI